MPYICMRHLPICPIFFFFQAEDGIRDHCVTGVQTCALKEASASALGGARGPLACWWGYGLPRQRWVAGLRGRSATLGLRHGPDSYGRQQWGILRNARKRDAATPRGGRRPSGCKPLSVGTKLRR